MSETRWCDMGCGYKLPPEYSKNETICGACLDEIEQTQEDKEQN